MTPSDRQLALAGGLVCLASLVFVLAVDPGVPDPLVVAPVGSDVLERAVARESV